LRIDSDLNSYRFNVPNYKRGGNKWERLFILLYV
jgi:hypothetical protein